MKTYEECLINDNNWYTYRQMGDMYPFDEVYCITRKDPETRATLYQPKVLTTCNIDVRSRAREEYQKYSIDIGEEYCTQVFIGPIMLSMNLKAFKGRD